MGGTEAEAVPAAKLCPGCCAMEDIRACEATAGPRAFSPLVGCSRCAFTFPILPGEFMQVTLDAMRNHDCHGIYRGNWPALGEGIIEGMHESGISKQALAVRLAGKWPGRHDRLWASPRWYATR